MRVIKINIKNFRQLRDTTLDLEDELTVVIGKNNTGKTSLLLCLEKFIGASFKKNPFTFEDINLDAKNELQSIVVDGAENSKNISISLKIFIKYGEDDDLENLGDKVIMDLEIENNIAVIAFEYYITPEEILRLREDFLKISQKRFGEGKKEKNLFDFLNDSHAKYFSTSRRSLHFDWQKNKEIDDKFVDLDRENIDLSKVINFKWISARRNVSNQDTENSLSQLSAKLYKKLESNEASESVVESFKETLSDTDSKLNVVYGEIFKDVINDVRRFGGLTKNDSVIKIVSSLQHRNLLEENATVMYGLGGGQHDLPENYNGLGYLNLISMIFEIKLKIHDFNKELHESPADINLLFIEEPEAHTHPQLQRIFIKNIKLLLKSGIFRSDGISRKIQTILTTHSSYIVSESNFEDIKYLKKTDGGVIAKNLKELKDYYEDSQHYTFLKQYLTIHRSELFFADKAILIEGDTERILIPAMMSKIDNEDLIQEIESNVSSGTPLLSQNISMIEVGAYSHIFDKFVNFIGVKTLIITDIDSSKLVQSVDSNGNDKLDKDGEPVKTLQKCCIEESTHTTNSSLKFFYKNSEINFYSEMKFQDKSLSKDKDSNWIQNVEGNLLCAYQTLEKNAEGEKYHARSFEDSFFHINKSFIKNISYDENHEFTGGEKLPSLVQKHLKSFVDGKIGPYDFAEKAIGSKPSFAMEVLLNSTIEEKFILEPTSKKQIKISVEFHNWNTPSYIEEALKWIKKD
ncbi:ATP-dependent nuclease [Pectobacterium actinidiae]|uniref:ATP-dependent nuclease n=1 Tax=Pectobacterium actinidiae TaxID=1507808 RepID=UPI0037F7F957